MSLSVFHSFFLRVFVRHSFFQAVFLFLFFKVDLHRILKANKRQRGHAFVQRNFVQHFFVVRCFLVCNFALCAFIMCSFVLPACNLPSFVGMHMSGRLCLTQFNFVGQSCPRLIPSSFSCLLILYKMTLKR